MADKDNNGDGEENDDVNEVGVGDADGGVHDCVDGDSGDNEDRNANCNFLLSFSLFSFKMTSNNRYF